MSRNPRDLFHGMWVPWRAYGARNPRDPRDPGCWLGGAQPEYFDSLAELDDLFEEYDPLWSEPPHVWDHRDPI